MFDKIIEIISYIPKVLDAFPTTMYILVSSLILSMILGFIVTVGSLSNKKIVNKISGLYIAFTRGLPSLVLLFLVYFGLTQVLNDFGIKTSGIPKIAYITLCLGMSASANMSEMMRSAYLSIDKGQQEAALSIGMTKRKALTRIILPQAIGVAIPTFGNNVIMLFKETSLAFVINVLDMFGKARAMSAATYGVNRLELYVATGIIFWMVCIFLENIFKIVEKTYTKGRKASTS